MEFLKDHKSFQDLSITSRLLKNLQKYYFHIFIAIYNELETAAVCTFEFPQLYASSAEGISSSHSLSRCYITRSILNLFFISPSTMRSTFIPDISNATWNEPQNVDITTITFSGPIFPDHTLIFLRTGTEFYILQSYYYAYMLTGKYGVIKLSKTEAEKFLDILKHYKALEGREHSLENILQIFDLNRKLSKYTGINADMHYADSFKIQMPNLDQKNFIQIENAKMDFATFLINVYRKLSLISQSLRSVFFDTENRVLTMPFNYHFYDAFFEGPIEGNEKKFEYLVGHKYQTGIEGIRTGYMFVHQTLKDRPFYSYVVGYEISVPERIIRGELNFFKNQVLFYLRENFPLYFALGLLPQPEKVKYQKLEFNFPF